MDWASTCLWQHLLEYVYHHSPSFCGRLLSGLVCASSGPASSEAAGDGQRSIACGTSTSCLWPSFWRQLSGCSSFRKLNIYECFLSRPMAGATLAFRPPPWSCWLAPYTMSNHPPSRLCLTESSYPRRILSTILARMQKSFRSKAYSARVAQGACSLILYEKTLLYKWSSFEMHRLIHNISARSASPQQIADLLNYLHSYGSHQLC